MEGLSWQIYFCSITGGILTVALLCLIASIGAFIIPSFIYLNDECKLESAKKWRKYSGIVGTISMLLVILTPSKTTCYQIFGVTVATEVIKNSEALQELPEKSFEAINRLLDSIAANDNKDKE